MITGLRENTRGGVEQLVLSVLVSASDSSRVVIIGERTVEWSGIDNKH